MFSNLENFLNAAKPISNTAEEELNLFSNLNANDSWHLDTEKRSKNNDDDDEIESAEFVPSRGQKTMAKRLKKIEDTMANNLEQNQLFRSVEKKKTSKVPKKTPPKKPAARRGRGRGRRNDYVDLYDSNSMEISAVSSSSQSSRPAHDPDTIVLDCEDEFIGGPAVNFTRNLATAAAVSTEDKMDVKVSVKISGKVEAFPMSQFQTLQVVITQISEKMNVPPNSISLMFKNRTVSALETPNSIGYVQGLVIHAHISDKSKNSTDSKPATSDKLEIKIQAEGRKRAFVIYISPSDQLLALAFACAEEFNCDVNKVAIEFDGEFINFKETPEDLGLDGGEVMDFYLK